MKQANFFTTYFLIGLLSLAMLLLGYNHFKRPIWNKIQSQLMKTELPEPRQGATESAQTLKNQLVAALSPEEKVAQLLVLPLVVTLPATPSGTVSIDPETIQWIQTYKPAFVQLLGAKASSGSTALQPLSVKTVQQTKTALASISAQAQLPWAPALVVRHGGGTDQVLRGEGFTKLPTMASLCTDPEGLEPVVAKSAAELAKASIIMVVGPVIDLRTDQGFNQSQLCNDPTKLIQAARVYIENFGRERVVPLLAHFPGIGQATRDPRLQSQTLPITVSDLKPFQILLDTYPNLGVVVSSVGVADKFENMPCSQSAECLKNFHDNFAETLLIADEQATTATGSALMESKVTQAELSLRAGNHLLLFGKTTSLAQLTTIAQSLGAKYQQDEAMKTAVEQGLAQVQALRIMRTSN
jgi:hypothetical protein